MSTRHLLGIIASVGILLFAGGSSTGAPEPLEFPLETVELESERLRLGHRMKGRLPDTALALTDEAGTFLFLDLDRDRKITAGRDGLALRGFPFVVSLPEVLLLPFGQGRWAIRKGSGIPS